VALGGSGYVKEENLSLCFAAATLDEAGNAIKLM